MSDDGTQGDGTPGERGSRDGRPGPPSLMSEAYRRLYLADEAHAAEPSDERPWWLRLDYRQFLADAFDAAGMSLRGVAGWLGKSPATITYLLRPRVDDGRVRATCLSGPLLEQICVGIELPDEEVRLLRLLVNLEASRRSGEGDAGLFKRLIDQAWMHDTGYLAHDEAIVYARDFLNIVLREMVGLEGFRADPEWLRAHLLYPLGSPPSTAEIARAWASLVELGVVSEQAGRWRRGPSDVILGSGHSERARVLKDYFRLTLDAGKDALRLASLRRRFEARTVSVRRADLDHITHSFERLLDGLAESSDGEGDVVLHLMLLAFPVADTRGMPPEVS